MNIIALLRYSTVAAALLVNQAHAEEPQYNVIALKSPPATVQKAMAAASFQAAKGFPDTIVPSQRGLTFLVGLLAPAEVKTLLSTLHEAQDTNVSDTLRVAVESASSKVRDLKITGKPLDGIPMETSITVYPQTTVVMLSAGNDAATGYQVFLVSPK